MPTGCRDGLGTCVYAWRRLLSRPLLGLALVGTVCLMMAGVRVAAAPADVAVMIHGAGGGGWEYDRWRPLFARAGWQVVAPDLVPAKGGLEATTFDDYVQQVTEWVPQKHGRLVLVGASMGGILALKVAERIHADALVLVNSAPPQGIGKPREGNPYPAIVRWANGPIEDTRAALPDGDEATVRWAHPKWRDEAGAAMNTIHNGVPVRPSTVPTLVVLGAEDTDIPLESGLALARWAKADVQLYAGTSHIGPLYGRRAAEIATAVVRWLDATHKRTH